MVRGRSPSSTGRALRKSSRSRRPASRPNFQLRDFAWFWKDDASSRTCCLTASDDEIDEDPEAYSECATCPVAAELDGLCQSNRDIWTLYRQAVTRFAFETHSIPLVLERLTVDMDRDEFLDVMERFAILFEIFNPPPKGSGE
jgi:hypothetical protein